MAIEQNISQEAERYELSYMHQKQVMRLIAMSMADDGSVGKREFNEVCRITQEQWPGDDVPSMEVVEKIVRDIKSSLRETSTRQSVFMNVDALTNEDVAIEVRNLMRIIVVDNSITDREREAFIIYCRMMRVRNMSQLWRELSKMTLEQLRDSNIPTPKVKFRRRRSLMTLTEFEIIFDTFTFYKIHSPILDGACHILQREKTRSHARIFRQNKIVNNWAFAMFAFLGLAIYGLTAIPALHNLVDDNKVVYGTIVSICILFMMLAVEWLIFMRTNSKGAKVVSEPEIDESEQSNMLLTPPSHHNTSLALFVGIAILLDICLGIIELPRAEINVYGIAIKVVSAIFLGCICFFIGKFFENLREQQVNDVEKMGEVTERLHELADSYHNK